MIRSTVLALVVAGALVIPSSVSAGVGGTPLRTLCFSPTMDHCVSFFTFQFSYVDPTVTAGYNAVRFSATVDMFGAGYDAQPVSLWTRVDTDGDDFIGFVNPQIAGPGPYTIGDASPARLDTWMPTVYNIREVAFGAISGGPFVGLCRTAAYATAGSPVCHEPVSVPEPGSLLLLATGFVGLGAVGWRRRRAV